MTAILGVDIGGTKIQLSQIEPDYSVRFLKRVPTALMRRGTPAFAADLADLIRANMPLSAKGAAVSLNGALNGGLVVYSSLMGGRVDFDLSDYLAQRLGLPVHVDDDIHAMTAAEAKLGIGKTTRRFAMLNLGTGIGVGCFEDRVLRGRFGAGLISELLIHVHELDEYRSLDRVTCGRGLREMYLALSGRHVEAVNIFEMAKGNDAVAIRVVEIFTRCLAVAMAMISKFYHPEIIVINGSIKRAAGQYLEAAEAHYRSLIGKIYQAEITISGLDFAAEIGVALQGAKGFREGGIDAD